MISKFSVKKPLTVIMALLMVIILGYVSFTNMKTDLLPNMEMPYVAIITAYVGAGPEKVEVGLTKPLEQVLSTTSGVENVTSISSENYSAIILEFSENTNLDSAMTEMSSKVSRVTGSLGSSVGTPMYMKINPDLLPVVIASVDYEGLSRQEASKRTQEEVIPALERVEGVASVSARGLIENTMKITINDDKIDTLNDKIISAVDEKLLETEKELDDAQRKLDESKEEFYNMLEEQNKKLAEATVAVQSGTIQLQLGKSTVDTTVKLLDSASELIDKLDEVLNEAEQSSAKLKDRRPQFRSAVIAIRTALETAQNAVHKANEDLDKDGEYYEQISKKLKDIEVKLQTRIDKCDKALDLLAKSKNMKEAVQALRSLTGDLRSRCRSLRHTLSETSVELQKQCDLLREQQLALESGKLSYSQETAEARLKLNNAQEKLDEGREAFEKAKDEAYEAAGLDGAITVDSISKLISAENFSMPVGNITDDGVTYSVKVGDLFEDNKELENWELFNISVGDIGVITLPDIADIEYLDNSNDMYAKVNGNDGILLTLDKQSTYSTTDVSHNIQKTIKELEKKYNGLSVTALSDQGDYIDLVINSVLEALITGGILAILILLVFLRDVKPTLIIAVSIPASLLFAIVLMYFTGVSLNIISLAGLALGVGMLVDNSIVVVENVYRLKALGMPIKDAAISGAQQVAGAIIASTLTTVSVFLPIVFTQGITKQIFSDMGLTIAYSLLASLIVALTIVPSFSYLILKKSEPKKSKIFDRIINGYAKLLDFALKHKAAVIIPVVLLLALSAFGVTQMGTEFIPKSDTKQMSISIEMPKGTTRDEAVQMTENVIDRLKDIEDIDTIAAMQGGSGMMSMLGGGNDNSTSIYLLLKENRKHTSQEVAVDIENTTADLDCTLTVTSSNMSMSMLTGEGVEIAIKGDDLDDLQKAATDIGEMLGNIEGTVDVSTGLEDVSQEIRITVDKNKAMAKGYTVAQIYMKLTEALTTETTATTLEIGDNEYSVVVAADSDSSLNLDSLRNMKFDVADTKLEAGDAGKDDDTEASDSSTVMLKDIADISFANTPTAINRENQIRTMTVTAKVDAQHNVGKISNEVEAKLKTYNFPGDTYYEIAGENEYVTSALRDLVYMLLIAIAFIYMIMVAQFQSLKSPFIVMLTIPLAFTGGMLLLWATGFNLSVVAMLGLLVLSGVVVNNGIVFVDCANQLVRDGKELHDALIETGRIRIRPIIMTAITTILGLTTIALGIGDGTDMVQPMGIVVIGGLLYATVLTLFVIPVLYSVFNKKSAKRLEKSGGNE